MYLIAEMPVNKPTTGVPGGFGRIGLGAVASGDHVAVFAAQQNEARRIFGETSTPKPGRTDIHYPNLTGDYTKRLLDYWTKETQRALPHVMDIPESAIRTQWLRAANALTGPAMQAVRGLADIGSRLMPQSISVDVWNKLSDVVLGMGAMRITPTRWELAKEAAIEAAKNVARPIIPALNAGAGIVKWAAIAAIAYFGYSAYQTSRRGAR